MSTMKAIKAILEHGKLVLAEPLPDHPGKLSAVVFIAGEDGKLPATDQEVDKIFQDWLSMPASSREAMMFQTQSATYGQWMQEEEWDTERALLPLSDFKPKAGQ